MARTLTVKQVAARVATAKQIEPSAAAKLVRQRIRTNSALIEKAWPQLEAAKKAPRDGNRYPAMPERLANAIVKSFATDKALKDIIK